jgi:hypothetical protein
MKINSRVISCIPKFRDTPTSTTGNAAPKPERCGHAPLEMYGAHKKSSISRWRCSISIKGVIARILDEVKPTEQFLKLL